MKTLFLVRHGKSSWSDSNLPDRERPLKKRGLRQADALGPALRRHGAFDGAVHASTAARASETASRLIDAAAATDQPGIHFQEALYTFRADDLLAWLESQPKQSPVTIIGHNPALLELANRLLKTPLDSLRTGAAVQISLPGISWSQVQRQTGEMTTLLLPEHLDYRLFRRKAPAAPDLDHASIAQRIPASLGHQARLIEALEAGVREGQDPEFLHQFRVNLRKSRAIAEALQRVKKNQSLTRGIKGLRRQAQATSHLRDLDVFLETLSAWREIPSRRAAIDALGIEDVFREKQTREHRQLRELLDSEQYRDDMQRWMALINDGELRELTRKINRKRIRKALDKQISRHNEVLDTLNHDSPDSDFHRVRKALKRVRYLIELDPRHLAHTIKGLKSRQKLLGRFQDRHVQGAFLGEMVSPKLSHDERSALDQLIEEVSAEKLEARSEILALKPLRRQ